MLYNPSWVQAAYRKVLVSPFHTYSFVPRLSISNGNTADWSNRDPDGHLPSVLTTIDPVQHKQRRRTWDRAFSTAAIKNYEDIIVRKTRELLDHFEKRAGEQIDFSMWMRHFSWVLSFPADI
jgi:cytochrome P450